MQAFIISQGVAKLCVEGVRRMYEYCGRKNLPHQQVAKLIVATGDADLPILEELYERAMANGVSGVELISSKRVQELEPNVRPLQALHSPHTGITDYATVGWSLLKISFLQAVVKSTQGQLPSPFSWLIDSPEEFICSSFHNLGNLHLNCDLLRKVGSSQF
jgi:2-hydroxyglutarate dehydrogenase